MIKVALVYNLKKPKSDQEHSDCFSEFDSPKTIEAIASALRVGGHEVFLVEANREFLDWLRQNPIDIVFNVAEGSFGLSRESQVPAILDFLNIPYTGSGVLALALSLDKAMAKQIFMYKGIPTPKFQLFRYTDKNDSLTQNLQFPLIVKPNCEGSAIGIHASNVAEDDFRLVEEIAKIKESYQQDVLVEEFIEGREFTVGILGNDDPQILPILEVDFTNCKKRGEPFYSWEVKEYQGIDRRYPDPEFFCPAKIKPEQENQIKEVALCAHQTLGCRDVSRVDIRLSRDLVPYVLEVNPLPGLDPCESNLTRMGVACGIKYPDLLNRILESALRRYRMGPRPSTYFKMNAQKNKCWAT